MLSFSLILAVIDQSKFEQVRWQSAPLINVRKPFDTAIGRDLVIGTQSIFTKGIGSIAQRASRRSIERIFLVTHGFSA